MAAHFLSFCLIFSSKIGHDVVLSLELRGEKGQSEPPEIEADVHIGVVSEREPGGSRDGIPIYAVHHREAAPFGTTFGRNRRIGRRGQEIGRGKVEEIVLRRQFSTGEGRAS